MRVAAGLLASSREAVQSLTATTHQRQFEALAGMLGWPRGLEAPTQSRSQPGTPRWSASGHAEHASLFQPGGGPVHAQQAAAEILRTPGEELALQLLVLQAWQPILR